MQAGGAAGPQFTRILAAAPGAVLSTDLWFDLLEADHKLQEPRPDQVLLLRIKEMDWSTTGLCLDPLKMTSLPSTMVDFKQGRTGAGER